MRLLIPLILLLTTSRLGAQDCYAPDSTTAGSAAPVQVEAGLPTGSTDSSFRLLPEDLRLLQYYRSKGVPFDTTCSQIELYREVYAWLGVRYRYAGLTKRGVDCAGFVKNICNAIYGTRLSGSASHHFRKCVPIERDELEEGDLVFFKIRKSYISHVGIYLGNGKFAHAAVHGGVIISDLSEAYYNKYYYVSGRLIHAPHKKTW